MMKDIKLFPDYCMLEKGVLQYIKWDYIKYPHGVIFGATGSGKTYLVKVILGRIAKHIENAELVICDYKSDDDFSFLSECSNFYRYNQCENGLNYTINKLKERQQDSYLVRNPIFMLFDEWASYLNSIDKKVAEEEKKKLATLLMLGRSFNIHVLISQQRLDAVYFNSSRDNFSMVIGMGKLTKESVEMMFSEYKENIKHNKDRGQGYLMIGSQLKEIIVPAIKKSEYMQKLIIHAASQTENQEEVRGDAAKP